MTTQPPDDLIPAGTSPVFTHDTLPDALQAEHTLAPGHWAVLNILKGSLRFTNLKTGEARLISAPNHVTIHPGLPHKVAIDGPLRCRIDFYREPRAHLRLRVRRPIARPGSCQPQVTIWKPELT